MGCTIIARNFQGSYINFKNFVAGTDQYKTMKYFESITQILSIAIKISLLLNSYVEPL